MDSTNAVKTEALHFINKTIKQISEDFLGPLYTCISQVEESYFVAVLGAIWIHGQFAKQKYIF